MHADTCSPSPPPHTNQRGGGGGREWKVFHLWLTLTQHCTQSLISWNLALSLRLSRRYAFFPWLASTVSKPSKRRCKSAFVAWCFNYKSQFFCSQISALRYHLYIKQARRVSKWGAEGRKLKSLQGGLASTLSERWDSLLPFISEAKSFLPCWKVQSSPLMYV